MENQGYGGVVHIDPSRRHSRRMRRLRDDLKSYAFLLPFIVGALVFTAYPIVMSVVYSFTDYNSAIATRVGIFNYTEQIFRSVKNGGIGDHVLKSFGITFIFCISSTVLNLVLSYILALFLHNKIPGIRLIRVLCYLPCLIPGLAGLYIWRDILAFNTTTAYQPYEGLGIFNVWLKKLGLPTATFFGAANTSIISLLISGLWNLGGGMIMWIAAFENISPEFYEAAKIDGAGYLKCLFRITLPLSTPILFYNLVVSMIGGLQVFGTYAAYGKGVEESLDFVAVHIYDLAFVNQNHLHGLACAMSWLLFIVIALLSLVMFKTGNWVQYGDE